MEELGGLEVQLRSRIRRRTREGEGEGPEINMDRLRQLKIHKIVTQKQSNEKAIKIYYIK